MLGSPRWRIKVRKWILLDLTDRPQALRGASGVNFCAPGSRSLNCFAQIQRSQLPVGQQSATGDPNIADLMAANGVDQLRDWIVDRLGFRPTEINGDHVGSLAGLQRADFISQPQGLRGVERGHAQNPRRRQNAGVAGDRFAQQGGSAHFAEQVEIVVAGRPVGAQGDIDASGIELGCGAEAAGQLEVGFRAVNDVSAA
jgi:hypothetical protein